MSCPLCRTGVKSWEREYVYQEGYPSAEQVVQGKKPFAADGTEINIIECKQCGVLWTVSIKEMYLDPRDRGGPPPYVDVSARLIEGEEEKLVRNPSLEGLTWLCANMGLDTYPYPFTDYYIQTIGARNPEALIEYFDKQVKPFTNYSLQAALLRWYKKARESYFTKIWEAKTGAYLKDFIRLPQSEQVDEIDFDFLTPDLLALYTRGKKSRQGMLRAYSLTERRELWRLTGLAPLFPEERFIRPFFCTGGVVIILHEASQGNPPASISAPGSLTIVNTQGKRIHEQKIDWYAEQWTHADDKLIHVSQNRYIHTFHMTLLGEVLYFADGLSLIALDIRSGKVRWQAISEDVYFNGIVFDEGKHLLAAAIDGFIRVGKNGRLYYDESFIFRTCPVAVFPGNFIVFQDGSVGRLDKNDSDQLQHRIQLGELRSPPLWNGQVVLIPTWKETVFISPGYEIVARYPISVHTTFDSLDRHLYELAFTVGRHFVIYDTKCIHLFGPAGNLIASEILTGYLEKFGPIGDKALYVIARQPDERKEEIHYRITTYTLDLERISSYEILSPDISNVGSNGIYITDDGEGGEVRLRTIDLLRD